MGRPQYDPLFDNGVVPFGSSGNRRFISDTQLMEHAWLSAFMSCFADRFERDAVRCVYWFIEAE